MSEAIEPQRPARRRRHRRAARVEVTSEMKAAFAAAWDDCVSLNADDRLHAGLAEVLKIVQRRYEVLEPLAQDDRRLQTEPASPKADPLFIEIWEEARRLGVSLTDLSVAAEVSRPAVSLMHSGKRRPSLPVARAMAARVGCDIGLRRRKPQTTKEEK